MRRKAHGVIRIRLRLNRPRDITTPAVTMTGSRIFFLPRTMYTLAFYSYSTQICVHDDFFVVSLEMARDAPLDTRIYVRAQIY